MTRIIEEKLPGEELSTAQQNVLPLLAGLIDLQVKGKTLPEGSGVFVMWHATATARTAEADDEDLVVIQKVPTHKLNMDRMPTWRGKLGQIRGWLSGEFQEIKFSVEES